MNEYQEYSEYNDERQRVPWKRIILTLVSLIVIFVIVLLLLKACVGKKDREKDLLEAGKQYYTDNFNELPDAAGECKTVTLDKLVESKLLNADKYASCDGGVTQVKVCYLENKTYHYVPIMSCSDGSSKFGVWATGTLSNVVPNETDIRFNFMGEQLNKGNKKYYPNDLTDGSKVIEYYTTAPKKDYNNKEAETTEAYKWYVEKNVSTYWNNGGYSSTQPSGYPIKGASTTVTTLTDTKPATASYRTIKSATIYRTQSVAKPYKYDCSIYANGKLLMLNNLDEPCENRMADYEDQSNVRIDTIKIYFTCDSKDKIEAGTVKEVEQGTACGKVSEWTTKACESSKADGINCEKKNGYSYTDTRWKWSKNETVKSYYPSGSTDVKKENTYYVEAPVKGAIKDTATKATAYKFYKIVKADNNASTNVEEWVPVNENYVTESELIDTFKKLGYEVNTLYDIYENENIRYQLQLQYRNKIAE